MLEEGQGGAEQGMGLQHLSASTASSPQHLLNLVHQLHAASGADDQHIAGLEEICMCEEVQRAQRMCGEESQSGVAAG